MSITYKLNTVASTTSMTRKIRIVTIPQEGGSMTIKNINISILAVTAFLCAGFTSIASAATWEYPDEISVAEAYNKIFFTDFDESTTEGLDNLLSQHGVAMQSQWDTSVAPRVSVLTLETTSNGPVGILVDDTFLLILDPGPWTPPSRGWINDPLDGTGWSAGIVDIGQLLIDNGFSPSASFSFVMAGNVLDSNNTHRIEGNDTNRGFLLAYNEGGVNAGDGDANEPILYVNPPDSVPGSCDGMIPTIVGTTQRDVIYGTFGDDVIHGADGKDYIDGRGGDDVLCGGDGDDVLEGKGGDDKLIGHFGNDRLFGHAGHDIVSGNEGDDTVRGNGGNDILSGGAGDDRVVGDAGNDTMEGNAGDDRLYGGLADDSLDGGDGTDVCDGSGGIDSVENCERVIDAEIGI